jgi:hypothetical protein
MALTRIRSLRLRARVKRQFEIAAVLQNAGETRRLFPIVSPEAASLLACGRVEATLEELADARWLCAEVRRG